MKAKRYLIGPGSLLTAVLVVACGASEGVLAVDAGASADASDSDRNRDDVSSDILTDTTESGEAAVDSTVEDSPAEADSMAGDTAVEDTGVDDTAMSDATPDAAADASVTDAEASVDASCGDADLTIDIENCGACGHVCGSDDAGGAPYCSSGTCATTTDITLLPTYWTTAATSPYMEMWTGSLFSGQSNLSLDTGAATPFLLGGNTGFAPSLGSDIVIAGGIDKAIITRGSGPMAWGYSNPAIPNWDYGAGCCNYNPDGAVSVDAANGFGYFATTRFSLSNAAHIATLPAGPANCDRNAIDGDIMWDGSSDGQLWRGNFGTTTWDWHLAVGTSPICPGDPAVLANGDVAVASPTGELALFKGDASGTKHWSASFAPFTLQPLVPITVATGPVAGVDSAGLLLQTTGTPGLVAYKISDGSVAWTSTITSRVDDVVAGEGGLVYALVAGSARIYALDVVTGATVFRYSGIGPGTVGSGAQLLLRAGRIFVNLKGQVSSFPVPSKGYDSGSAWPVQFHDNQRTNCVTSPMAY
jgi:hypothetical protein